MNIVTALKRTGKKTTNLKKLEKHDLDWMS